MDYQYSEITPEVIELAKLCTQKGGIDPSLYAKYEVKRGLRDINGKGVLAGLTEISEVHANDIINGESVPCEGRLYYRGINVEDIVAGFMRDERFGFEETVYLLLFEYLIMEGRLIMSEINSIDVEEDQFAYRYDTQLLIDRRDEDLDEDEISDYITEHFEGNCLIAVGDEDLIKIHFHTNEPWKVLEYCNSIGEIYDIVVEDMIRQSNGLQG